LPEMLVWWGSFPFLILGLWFTIKYRLRQALPILIFTSMLTLSYSIFQGNIGTAYRQRSQLMVFYFIFAAVGFAIMQEVRGEKKRLAGIKAEEQAAKLAALRESRVAEANMWKQEARYDETFKPAPFKAEDVENEEAQADKR
jgi:hypothetical protein